MQTGIIVGISVFAILVMVVACCSIISIAGTQKQRLYQEIKINEALEYQNRLTTHIDSVQVEILTQISLLNSKLENKF